MNEEVKPKFKMGETVFRVVLGGVEKNTIAAVLLTEFGFSYCLGNFFNKSFYSNSNETKHFSEFVEENMLFSSKEELKASL